MGNAAAIHIYPYTFVFIQANTTWSCSYLQTGKLTVQHKTSLTDLSFREVDLLSATVVGNRINRRGRGIGTEVPSKYHRCMYISAVLNKAYF